MGHTQTENYDLSQPICKKPQLALEALNQIIQANKAGNNETAIFMTVKRCQTCGAWPTCRLPDNSVAIIIECIKDGRQHSSYHSGRYDSVKGIIAQWNETQNIVGNLKSVKDTRRRKWR